MPTESCLETVRGELAQIVESVFATMFSLEVDEVETPWFPADDRLTAAVHLAGPCNGAVLLECTRGQACGFAGRFLSQDPPSSVDDVVRDVLGELANMIGGNLKSALTQGIQLSMPMVVNGSDYSVRVYRAEIQDRLAFTCAEGTFWITILTMRPETPALR